MSTRYGTALSYLVLFGSGCYCLKQTGAGVFGYQQVAYSVIIINGVVGTVRWAVSDASYDLVNTLEITKYFQKNFVLPLLTTSFFFSSGYSREISTLPTIVSCVFLILYVVEEDPMNELINPALCLDCLCLGCFSFLKEKYCGVVAAIEYAISHLLWSDVYSSEDLYNYGMSIFAIIAFKTLGGELPMAKAE